MSNALRNRSVMYIVLLFAVIAGVQLTAGVFLLRGGASGALLALASAGMAVTLAGVIVIYIRSLKPVDNFYSTVQRMLGEHCGEQLPGAGSVRSIDRITAGLEAMAHAMKDRDEQLKELTENMCESERLATLGELAAGVAHELNNPLGGILVYSHLLLEDTDPEDPRYTNIGKIIKESNRCKSIVKSLLDFARQSHPILNSIDVNDIVVEALNNLRNEQMFEHVTVTNKLNETLPHVLADASQIQEVFENIIRNAAEVMDGRGELIITSCLADDDKGKPVAEVIFEDTGPGISGEHIDHIFDPFYTTKIKGHGTGLGLAVSYGILERHNSTIAVGNRPEGGAVFTVQLQIGEADG